MGAAAARLAGAALARAGHSAAARLRFADPAVRVDADMGRVVGVDPSSPDTDAAARRASRLVDTSGARRARGRTAAVPRRLPLRVES